MVLVLNCAARRPALRICATEISERSIMYLKQYWVLYDACFHDRKGQVHKIYNLLKDAMLEKRVVHQIKPSGPVLQFKDLWGTVREIRKSGSPLPSYGMSTHSVIHEILYQTNEEISMIFKILSIFSIG